MIDVIIYSVNNEFVVKSDLETIDIKEVIYKTRCYFKPPRY